MTKDSLYDKPKKLDENRLGTAAAVPGYPGMLMSEDEEEGESQVLFCD